MTEKGVKISKLKFHDVIGSNGLDRLRKINKTSK
jgi:hypothetical protein